jgi:hypothetical protein
MKVNEKLSCFDSAGVGVEDHVTYSRLTRSVIITARDEHSLQAGIGRAS